MWTDGGNIAGVVIIFVYLAARADLCIMVGFKVEDVLRNVILTTPIHEVHALGRGYEGRHFDKLVCAEENAASFSVTEL